MKDVSESDKVFEEISELEEDSKIFESMVAKHDLETSSFLEAAGKIIEGIKEWITQNFELCVLCTAV